MQELITQGTIISIVGYLLVFVVLGIIWGILEATKLFFIKGEKKEKATESQPVQVEKTTAAKANDLDEDEEELIAVLTAAVAASMGRTSTYNLKIKSYRRIGTLSPAWNRISRQENLS